MNLNKLKAEMKSDLQGWGIGLLIMGVLSNIFRNFFDPTWGVILILIGLLTLLIMERKMYLVIGASLIAIGLLNIIYGLFGGWTFFGIIQIVIGIQELYK
ncbi:MAG: hypothetical protein NTW67_02240, partial [Candidatus Woesearchaeota archaeon]|nr:hypothetical protein [Candidatus Woesearchaeota archaeon]